MKDETWKQMHNVLAKELARKAAELEEQHKVLGKVADHRNELASLLAEANELVKKHARNAADWAGTCGKLRRDLEETMGKAVETGILYAGALERIKRLEREQGLLLRNLDATQREAGELEEKAEALKAKLKEALSRKAWELGCCGCPEVGDLKAKLAATNGDRVRLEVDRVRLEAKLTEVIGQVGSLELTYDPENCRDCDLAPSGGNLTRAQRALEEVALVKRERDHYLRAVRNAHGVLNLPRSGTGFQARKILEAALKGGEHV